MEQDCSDWEYENVSHRFGELDLRQTASNTMYDKRPCLKGSYNGAIWTVHEMKHSSLCTECEYGCAENMSALNMQNTCLVQHIKTNMMNYNSTVVIATEIIKISSYASYFECICISCTCTFCAVCASINTYNK